MYGKGYGSLQSVEKKSEQGVPQRELDVKTIQAIGRDAYIAIWKLGHIRPKDKEAKRKLIEVLNEIEDSVYQANDCIGKRYEQSVVTLFDKISNTSEDNINSQSLADESID